MVVRLVALRRSVSIRGNPPAPDTPAFHERIMHTRRPPCRCCSTGNVIWERSRSRIPENLPTRSLPRDSAARASARCGPRKAIRSLRCVRLAFRARTRSCGAAFRRRLQDLARIMRMAGRGGPSKWSCYRHSAFADASTRPWRCDAEHPSRCLLGRVVISRRRRRPHTSAWIRDAEKEAARRLRDGD